MSPSLLAPTSCMWEGYRAESSWKGALNSVNSNRQQKGPVPHFLIQPTRALLLHETEVSTFPKHLNWQLPNKIVIKAPVPKFWAAFLFHMRQQTAFCSPGYPSIFPPSSLHNSHLITHIQSLMQKLADLVQITSEMCLCISLYTGSKCKSYDIQILEGSM